MSIETTIGKANGTFPSSLTTGYVHNTVQKQEAILFPKLWVVPNINYSVDRYKYKLEADSKASMGFRGSKALSLLCPKYNSRLVYAHGDP